MVKKWPNYPFCNMNMKATFQSQSRQFYGWDEGWRITPFRQSFLKD